MCTNSSQRQERERDRKRDREWQCVTDVAMAPALLPRTQNGLADRAFSCTKNPKLTVMKDTLLGEPNSWCSFGKLVLYKANERVVFLYLVSFRPSKGANKEALLISDSVNTNMMKHLKLKLEVGTKEWVYSIKTVVNLNS